MYLDATYLHVRTEQAMVVSKAVVVANFAAQTSGSAARGAVDRADEGASPFYCRADGTSEAALSVVESPWQHVWGDRASLGSALARGHGAHFTQRNR
ncbi:hypothetical protein GCM10009529_17390 [Micropruina glycogenica]